MLEHCVREDLNKRAPRVMAVLRPLKLVIDNYPEDQVEELEAVNNPEDPAAGTRKVPFSQSALHRAGRFPRRSAEEVLPARRRDVKCACATAISSPAPEWSRTKRRAKSWNSTAPTIRPRRGGNSPDGRKVKATMHWVSAEHAIDAEVRLYDTLFSTEDPNEEAEGQDWHSNLNPNSLEAIPAAKVEPSLRDAEPGFRCQFERLGYFCCDKDSTPGRPVFNRTVTLRDTWAKIEKTLKG